MEVSGVTCFLLEEQRERKEGHTGSLTMAGTKTDGRGQSLACGNNSDSGSCQNIKNSEAEKELTFNYSDE